MKVSAVLSVALFLTISSTVAQSLSIDPSVGGLQLSSLLQHSVGKILSEFGHAAIAKRQTVYDITTKDVVDCVSRTIEYQCGSSGYSQKVADIATGCRNDSYARNTANTCARNDKGETCGAVALKFLSDQTNAQSCIGSVANDFCSSECRNFLESAKDSLGCCLNAYVNKTDYPLFDQYREHVDYRLWDLCEIDLPEEECKDSGIKMDFSKDVKSCTSQEILTNFVRYECSADIGQSLVDNLMKNDRCYIFSAVMVDACSSNGNGQYCAETLGTDLMNTFGTDPYIIALNSDCPARDPAAGCSPACKQSINAVRQAYGCCVNVYNDSSIGLQLGALSYSVWNECGIESPGFCQTTQTLPTKPPVIIPTDDSIPEITTESVPATPQRGAPISSSERPDVGVIIVTEFIAGTTEPDVVTENIVSTEEGEIIEETESIPPVEPTETIPLEEDETTQQPEENEPTIGEEDIMEDETVEPTESIPLEEDETTQPPEENEPTIGEEDIVEDEPVEPTESIPLEEGETTQPEENEPTTGEEDIVEDEPMEPTETIPLEEDETTQQPEENEPTIGEEDIMEDEPEEPTESIPLEEAETTQQPDAENEPTPGEEDDIMETSAPTQVGMEDDTEIADTTAAPEIVQPSEPDVSTPNDEDSGVIDGSEESGHATDHESSQPQSVSESVQPSTEAADSTHPSDHSQTASQPTVGSEAGENVEVVQPNEADSSAGEHVGGPESESNSRPGAGSQGGLSPQSFSDSLPSARALFSTVIAVAVVVTVFIQQL